MALPFTPFSPPSRPHKAHVVMQPEDQAATPSLGSLKISPFHSLNLEVLWNKFTYQASALWQHEVGNGKDLPFSGKWSIKEFIPTVL